MVRRELWTDASGCPLLIYYCSSQRVVVCTPKQLPPMTLCLAAVAPGIPVLIRTLQRLLLHALFAGRGEHPA